MVFGKITGSRACAREPVNHELGEKKMKKSEKIEIISYVLVIMAIFTLIQSPLLNGVGVIMAIRMLFRLKSIYGNEKPTLPGTEI